jgi:2-polyprenyl-3-methyl-5-hydroxy-6-metoxy-1,4-benzoquinol methylase
MPARGLPTASAMKNHPHGVPFSELFPEVVYDRLGRQQKASKILSVLSDFLGKRLRERRILDIGCSSGIISNFIADRVQLIVGTDVDISSVFFANREKKLNSRFLPSDAQALPFREEAFDIVICAHIYEHVPAARKLMREIHRVLRPGGICFLAAGNRLRLMEPHYRLPLLSILPSALADTYLRITGKGSHYEENHLTYWGLKRLVSKFQVFDYTRKILQDPEQYSATDLCKPGSLKQKSAILFSRLAYGLVPTYIFLLRKIKP